MAAEAGREAFKRWCGELDIWEKSPGEKVSDADLLVDDLLRERLAKLDPDAGYLSEESVDDISRMENPRLWVVDPIDGTRDFIRERPGWCISVALIENNQPIIGVLDAPARNEQWCAEAGQGSTRNGKPLAAGNRTEFDGSRVPAEYLPKTDFDLVCVEKPNSIALRIAMVAADEADLVATLRWGHEWDIAAAALIASEAGAAVSDGFGEKLIFNTHLAEAFGVMVSVPGIHQAALDRLRSRAEEAAVR